MKKFRTYLIFSLAIITFASVNAQTECKVLSPDLTGTYEGKCKKGFAHGEGKAIGIDTYEGKFRKGLPNGHGVYTWANGDIYTGNWVFGLREGDGTFTFKYEGNDSVQSGIWKADIFKGPEPNEPTVTYKRNIDRHTIRKKSDEGNQLEVRVYQSGGDNNVENYTIVGSSGVSYSSGNVDGLENILFPVSVKISYITWNKSHTQQLNASIEFEIFEEGTWEIALYN